MARTKGARNKYPAMPASLIQDALIKLAIACGNGEQWAIQEVLKRVPSAMSEPVPGGVQEKILNARIFELQEMEQRLKKLEQAAGIKHEDE